MMFTCTSAKGFFSAVQMGIPKFLIWPDSGTKRSQYYRHCGKTGIVAFYKCWYRLGTEAPVLLASLPTTANQYGMKFYEDAVETKNHNSLLFSCVFKVWARERTLSCIAAIFVLLIVALRFTKYEYEHVCLCLPGASSELCFCSVAAWSVWTETWWFSAAFNILLGHLLSSFSTLKIPHDQSEQWKNLQASMVVAVVS